VSEYFNGKNMTNFYKILYGFIFLFFPVFAFAYIDPGSASYFIQALIAAISAVLIYIRHPIDTIKRLIKFLFNK
jgi:hypothetical protein